MSALENDITNIFAEAISADPGLCDEVAALELVEFLTAFKARTSARITVPTTTEVLSLMYGLQPFGDEEMATRLGMDLGGWLAAKAWLEENPDAEIEIDPTAMHGFDDTFGRPEA